MRPFTLPPIGRPIPFAASLTALSLLAVPASLHAAGGAPAASVAGYHEIARYPVGGEGGWDYLSCDTAGHRLFITRGTHVQVVSTETGKVIGDIPNTSGCHGVALAPELKRGFVSDGRDNSVTVFDTETLKTLAIVPVGEGPDAILYDPATKRVLTFNGRGQSSTVLDAATSKVVGTIALGGKPEFAQADGKGKVFVNLEDKSELLTLDPAKLTVVAHTSLAPAEGPSGLAIDPKTDRLFAACDNQKAAVVDGTAGKLIATPTIGDGPDAAAFDPGTGLAFTSNGESGTLSILKQTAPGVYTTETVSTERGARTMTLDPATHRVYLVTAKFEPVPANAPTVNGRRPRPRMIPGSFTVLVFAPGK